MDQFVPMAEYILSLATNTLTDDIRNIYKASIVDRKAGVTTFELILKGIINNQEINNISATEAVEKIKNEFNALELSKYFGEIDNYTKLINLLINARSRESGTASINDFKDYIEAAAGISEGIAMSVYSLIMVRLLLGDMLLVDHEFSKAVIEYVKSSNVEKELYDVIHQALNHI